MADDDVRQAYCEHMGSTVDGMNIQQVFQREASPEIEATKNIPPAHKSLGKKTGLSPTHMRLIIWGLRALPREWLRAAYWG